MQNDHHAFNGAVLAIFAECSAVFTERSGQYGDSWGPTARFTYTALTRELVGNDSSFEADRLRCVAGLADAKQNRLHFGGFKDDSVLDGINYETAWLQWVREYQAARVAPPLAATTPSAPIGSLDYILAINANPRCRDCATE